MRKNRSKSSLFLIEMMMIILFLAISSTLCVQVFVKAHEKSADAQNLSQAVAAAGGAAELLRGGEADLMQVYPQSDTAANETLVYYDADWNMCDKQGAVYCMKIEVQTVEDTMQAQIAVLEMEGTEIYCIETAAHIGHKVER